MIDYNINWFKTLLNTGNKHLILQDYPDVVRAWANFSISALMTSSVFPVNLASNWKCISFKTRIKRKTFEQPILPYSSSEGTSDVGTFSHSLAWSSIVNVLKGKFYLSKLGVCIKLSCIVISPNLLYVNEHFKEVKLTLGPL